MFFIDSPTRAGVKGISVDEISEIITILHIEQPDRLGPTRLPIQMLIVSNTSIATPCDWISPNALSSQPVVQTQILNETDSPISDLDIRRW